MAWTTWDAPALELEVVATLWAMEIRLDPALPEARLELRNPKGNILAHVDVPALDEAADAD